MADEIKDIAKDLEDLKAKNLRRLKAARNVAVVSSSLTLVAAITVIATKGNKDGNLHKIAGWVSIIGMATSITSTYMYTNARKNLF